LKEKIKRLEAIVPDLAHGLFNACHNIWKRRKRAVKDLR